MVLYEFWYDYLKPKYGENAKLCSMDTDSFIVYVRTDNIYKDIVKNVEKRIDTCNYEKGSPLLKRKNKTVIKLIKMNKVDKSWKNLLD